MKQNKYDEHPFFSAYEKMPRSVHGLEGAGEWHAFRSVLPDMRGKQVLDLGCGFGWHCRYAREQQARSVTGVDISANMLGKARELTNDPAISYVQSAIEDVQFPECSFDLVLSSLAFHYIDDFEEVCRKVHQFLEKEGRFVFSVEHPIFTSCSEQDWHYDGQGNRLHWPIDHYQSEGRRDTAFLTPNVIKYHRTVSTYMNTMIHAGFRIDAVIEPMPSDEMLRQHPEMKEELRRPMFLIIAASKNRV
ncbi:class I SAM-dependent methyltransferase [Xylanibacillus composti]|uniref:SAM-dependent methyltransferase n=1 Tax=Xylanibacillus composti TaxID=1572762 RepID=A0A8J4H4S9_9BACL|nr:class I SAM-dependent methyltransferase [Xylanibacillus composti]MDT9727100.1 class I SAM-dependent methyltransferase [Xylanibacillus composti]GIQ68889.1 SAM-dependent methyltransferase [Xylanibacillus composti]